MKEFPKIAFLDCEMSLKPASSQKDRNMNPFVVLQLIVLLVLTSCKINKDREESENAHRTIICIDRAEPKSEMIRAISNFSPTTVVRGISPYYSSLQLQIDRKLAGFRLASPPEGSVVFIFSHGIELETY